MTIIALYANLIQRLAAGMYEHCYRSAIYERSFLNMYKCPNCGTDSKEQFCSSCGTKTVPANQTQQGTSSTPRPPGYMTPPGDTSVMSVKDWLITFLIFIIPCVNIVMLIVWAVSSTGNINRRNYARAYLILLGIILVLYLILWIIIGATLVTMFSVFY